MSLLLYKTPKLSERLDEKYPGVFYLINPHTREDGHSGIRQMRVADLNTESIFFLEDEI